ncbi:bifunctional phosphopantothenoylcysteine decarboxylase/phosphopantothenate synthase [Candidatus Methanoplasma termitum]|uniref:Coenzyme A biosynthesis bifunctional protein CoaBC n=1 Tax=Candidatus Methanoplasma termitum TaxID=1577791 RepID=A0A0A7LDQ1_9ARCH|nr:bifunctional phosphopantothenoylcysteine decarboxylase/phosphopantothenate--cysteine ligase CoaBC [Candidatus Methanoplasma termitum]AIZ57199.1 bifunctional phosphopantothenoylcysteine decarboxylase/phosphopantothenate synthase [Candidatus Methanoplasma termitum]MCL2334179.1 bifunctional phosphopantothenoylcysteine decarboxylase/phosphopantothenate--cysteine ligase CoaBC [Candidatus Methanoplasma sp.]
MHPSEEIYCEKSNRLRGKTIVIGITGSIAAVECFSVIRELVRNGAKVIPVMTQNAIKIVAPDAIEFACGVKPITELSGQTEHITHIGDPSAADLFIVYPATANTISKMANGIDDTAVTSMASVALGSKIPVAVAPAMHEHMINNPAVSKNLGTLAEWGVHIIGPHRDGVRAKVASKEEIVSWAIRLLSRTDLSGRRILIIGGRSEEPIDSMRMITNRSTGMMALALAKRAFERGADVELWMGGCSTTLPDFLKTKRFTEVSDLVEMLDMIDHDLVIMPAALADFTPAKKVDGKIPSTASFDIKLKLVPKVLPMIRKRCDNVIGFKAESGLTAEELEKKARQRLEEYDLKAVVANDIDVAGRSTSSAILVCRDGSKNITGTKIEVSDGILNYCAEIL